MGVASHPLILKYGLNKLWNVNLPLIDYKLHVLKSIYVKLYIENFLWYIVKCRYYRFFSMIPISFKGPASDVDFFFNRFVSLNNFRVLNKFTSEHKNIFSSKEHRNLKRNFFFSNVYYKDFIFSWSYIKFLYYRRFFNLFSKSIYLKN